MRVVPAFFIKPGTEPTLVAPRQLLSRRQQESARFRRRPFSHFGERPQQQQLATPVSSLLLQTALGMLGRRAPSANNLRSALRWQMVLRVLSDKGPRHQRLPLRPGLTSCSSMT